MSANMENTSSSGSAEGIHVDTWGTKGYLMMEQHEALLEFINAARDSDLSLAKFSSEPLESVSLRFLRARQFSVPNALELLKKCVDRKTAGNARQFAQMTPDECVKCDIEALNKFYPHSQLGYDKLNRPILYEQSGKVNPAAITTMSTFSSLIDYHWMTMEKNLDDMFRAAATNGKGPVVFSTCAVLDLEGLGVVHCTGAALDHVKAMIALDNVCYPETLGKMFVINSPWLAVTTWEIIKGWLDPRTQAKIEILGTGPDTSAKLLQYIDAEFLPVRYGGMAPDWQCQRPNVEHLQIPRSSNVTRDIAVPPGHTLYVDTYIAEGEVFQEVYVNPMQFNDGEESPSGKSTSSNSSVNLENMVQLSRESLQRPDGQANPCRNQQNFPNPTDANMNFIVRWLNPAILVGRSIVANIYTAPDPSLAR